MTLSATNLLTLDLASIKMVSLYEGTTIVDNYPTISSMVDDYRNLPSDRLPNKTYRMVVWSKDGYHHTATLLRRSA